MRKCCSGKEGINKLKRHTDMDPHLVKVRVIVEKEEEKNKQKHNQEKEKKNK